MTTKSCNKPTTAAATRTTSITNNKGNMMTPITYNLEPQQQQQQQKEQLT